MARNRTYSVFGPTSLVKGDILRALSDSSATCSELAARLGIERGGSLSRNLNELIEAGFVAANDNVNPSTGSKSKIKTYRICDNYTRFYLKYVEPHEDDIRAGRFPFTSTTELPGWRTMLGLQFENMVVNNTKALIPLLHLEGQHILSAAPFSLRSAAHDKHGLQIDLLIQTARTAILVEVKNRCRIESDIESEIKEKLRRFPRRRNVSLRTALVYDGELSPAVVRSGVFDIVIPFSKLLRLD